MVKEKSTLQRRACAECFESGFEYRGGDLSSSPSPVNASSALDCRGRCRATEGCAYVSFFSASGECRLKSGAALQGRTFNAAAASGPRECRAANTGEVKTAGGGAIAELRKSSFGSNSFKI